MTGRTEPPGGTTIDLPSHSDPVVAGLSEVIGGPIGMHARLSRLYWTPMRIVLGLATFAFALNWIQKSPCRDGRWADNIQYTKQCYTDVLALYYAEHLSDGAVPYVDHPVEYPVLTGYFMGILGLPVHWLGSQDWLNKSVLPALAKVGLAQGGPMNQGKVFYDVNAIALALFGLLSVWAIVSMRPRRPWDGAMVALAPAVFVTASVNWDLLVVGLTSLFLYSWSKKKLVLAGIFLGLAISAKFYPLFIVGPLLLLCIRRRKLPEFGQLFGVAAITWVAANLPVIVVARGAWEKFYSFNQDRGIDWGTFWYIGGHFQIGRFKPDLPFFATLGSDQNHDLLNNLSLGFFVVACVGIAALVFLAPRPPRLGQLAFLVVAAFLLTNKVWSQQFVLWLIPLAVLARPRWLMFLIWQVFELGYFYAFYQILLRSSGGKSALPEAMFTYAAIARWVSLAVLCGLVVRESLRPELDVVRASGEDDPEGGVLTDPDPEPTAPEHHPEEAIAVA
ncbi:MAG: hypothetical protein QOD41_1937 [Cryptosporangiaceae bacterium]|nr:hypothetical protein [Cryptosporangiaceae bacterium]